MNGIRHNLRVWICLLGINVIVHGVPALGQGTFLFTGSGQPLITATHPLSPFAATNNAPLEFDFGFATDEVFAPGGFFDSFTVTLQDVSQTYTLVIATADASGVVWAPVTPGALVMNANDILRAAIPYPGGAPTLAGQTAFQVSVPLPVQFQGLSANLYFDLFNNANGLASQGYYRLNFIPEPSPSILAMGGGLIWLFARRRK